MEQKIKVLQVFTQMGRGGAETMIMNYYRQLDKQKYQFDFLVHRKQRCDYDNEIEQIGGTIFRAFPIRPWNYFLYFKFLDSFFREHAEQYTAVHAHIQENSGIVLKYAAKYGIKNRVCTSHIANLGIDYKYPFRLYGKTYNKYITKRLACGKEAGKYLYGNKDFEVFPNAINLIDFKYNFKQNIAFRENHKWMGKFIVGNVARFCYQKNHTFLIDIFNEDKDTFFANDSRYTYIHNPVTFNYSNDYNSDSNCVIAVGRLCVQKDFISLIKIWEIVHGKCPNWKLKIVGDGPEKGHLQGEIDRLNLSESVRLVGLSNNIKKE